MVRRISCIFLKIIIINMTMITDQISIIINIIIIISRHYYSFRSFQSAGGPPTRGALPQLMSHLSFKNSYDVLYFHSSFPCPPPSKRHAVVDSSCSPPCGCTSSICHSLIKKFIRKLQERNVFLNKM